MPITSRVIPTRRSRSFDVLRSVNAMPRETSNQVLEPTAGRRDAQV
jgi:hypothetical protein